MGQLALGFRSLLFKLAVFVIMAALLAWALGGTLFPRPHVADLLDQATTIDGERYYWRVSIGARRQEHMEWRMMRVVTNGAAEEVDARLWRDGAGPLAAEGSVYYGGRDESGAWRLVRLDSDGRTRDFPMPDRLAVEAQLTRLRAGLPLQLHE